MIGSDRLRIEARDSFGAFSFRKPVSTSLESAPTFAKSLADNQPAGPIDYVDDQGPHAAEAAQENSSKMQTQNTPDNSFASRARRWIEHLGPYQSLALLAVPTSLVEPLKLVAVAVAGEGHWITGTIMIVVAYAASLLLVERLFRLVRPKLLMLPWFARFGTA